MDTDQEWTEERREKLRAQMLAYRDMNDEQRLEAHRLRCLEDPTFFRPWELARKGPGPTARQIGRAERIAEEASDESEYNDRQPFCPRGCDPRTIAATYCGLTLCAQPWWPCTCLLGGRIFYPSNVSEQATGHYVGHEVAHDLIRWHEWTGLDRDVEEWLCDYIGRALRLPRRAYLRDVAEVGRDTSALHALWPLVDPAEHAMRAADLLGP